jgi:hypothetical protein
VEWVNGRLEYIKCETGGGQWDYNISVRPQVRLEIKTEYDGTRVPGENHGLSQVTDKL